MDLIPAVEKDPPGIPGFRISFLLEILSLISVNVRKNEGEAPLKAGYIQRLIPQGWQYVRFLLDAGIITRSHKYKPGEISYTYKFADDFNSKFKTFPVTDPKLIRRISRIHLRRQNSKKYPTQNEFIRHMTIDPGSVEFANNNYPDIEKYNAALGSIIKILNRDIFYSVDNTSGRYHSNLTNLQSDLRAFVRINGKELVNIDIKNSQPYLFTVLATAPEKAAKHVRKSENFSMLLKTLQGIEALDVRLYVFLVISGTFYEYLIKEFGKYGLHYSRSEVKRQVFIILFGRNGIWNKQREIFNIIFPNIYERICQLKGSSRSKNKFMNYKRLSILLQSIEAHLVLDTILPRIEREHPGTIAVSIHDSIMTSILTNDEKRVFRIMNDELTKFTGYKPELKIENSPQNITREYRKKVKETGGCQGAYQYDYRTFGTG